MFFRIDIAALLIKLYLWKELVEKLNIASIIIPISNV